MRKTHDRQIEWEEDPRAKRNKRNKRDNEEGDTSDPKTQHQKRYTLDITLKTTFERLIIMNGQSIREMMMKKERDDELPLIPHYQICRLSDPSHTKMLQASMTTFCGWCVVVVVVVKRWSGWVGLVVVVGEG
jgi:hypothetical protein